MAPSSSTTSKQQNTLCQSTSRSTMPPKAQPIPPVLPKSRAVGLPYPGLHLSQDSWIVNHGVHSEGFPKAMIFPAGALHHAAPVKHVHGPPEANGFPTVQVQGLSAQYYSQGNNFKPRAQLRTAINSPAIFNDIPRLPSKDEPCEGCDFHRFLSEINKKVTLRNPKVNVIKRAVCGRDAKHPRSPRSVLHT